MKTIFAIVITLGFLLSQCSNSSALSQNFAPQTNIDTMKTDTFNINKTDEEWKKQLTADEYAVLRQKGTERPHTGEYDQFWDSGIYACKACGAELFKSETKFDAGCGWPSFYEGIDKSKIKEIKDNSHGMVRIEVVCANCGGHLGHVFNDGHGTPTGMRYCINSVSLGFKKK